MRIRIAVGIVFLVATGYLICPQWASAIDMGTTLINGEEVRYVLAELLIKPAPPTGASVIAVQLGASVLDSIPRIGWYRLVFPESVDVVPIWQALENDPRLQACGLDLAYSMPQTDGSGAGGGAEDQPEEEIQWPSITTRAVGAWSEVPQSSNILVAILDTGGDTDHPEFQGCSRIIWGLDWSRWPDLV